MKAICNNCKKVIDWSAKRGHSLKDEICSCGEREFKRLSFVGFVDSVFGGALMPIYKCQGIQYYIPNGKYPLRAIIYNQSTNPDKK